MRSSGGHCIARVRAGQDDPADRPPKSRGVGMSSRGPGGDVASGSMTVSSSTGDPLGSQPAAEEILCPLCEYNLRGTSEPRCPECGYTFDWQEVLDPRRRLHDYLFEHHPERNIRSFLQTAWHTWAPGTFWRSLHPGQPSRPRRLVAYWSIGAATFLAAFVLRLAITGYTCFSEGRLEAAVFFDRAPTPLQQQVIQNFGSRANFIRQNSRTFDQCLLHALGRIEELPLAAALGIVWPWATWAALLVFRWSMRRGRIRPVHVLRCSIYSFDLLWWVGVLLIIWEPLQLSVSARAASGQEHVERVGWMLGIAGVVGMYRLAVAYDRYLRFDRPIATVIASQIIAFLGVLAGASIVLPRLVPHILSHYMSP
jgi:hypothetical protein